MNRCLFSIFTMLLTASLSTAQAPMWQFRWQPGEVLIYRVEHVSNASTVSDGTKAETKTKLNLTKRWKVIAVDATGISTLELSLAALRWETVTPKGETLVYDSEDAAKSDSHLKEELGKYLGQANAILRVDPQGKVIEVKESRFGPASRFESEPPFAVVLPGEGPRADQTWERSYDITLEPPQGTGEKFPAVQSYQCKTIVDAVVTIGLTTTARSLPDNALDRIPLLEKQPTGTIVFDVQAGRMLSADLRIDKELTNYQGQGSSYHIQSTYKEELQK
jgi:hypothetical protein